MCSDGTLALCSRPDVCNGVEVVKIGSSPLDSSEVTAADVLSEKVVDVSGKDDRPPDNWCCSDTAAPARTNKVTSAAHTTTTHRIIEDARPLRPYTLISTRLDVLGVSPTLGVDEDHFHPSVQNITFLLMKEWDRISVVLSTK